MLIETSNSKTPRKSDLGNSLNVLDRATHGNGHVSRNIRLALLAVELVQPYTTIVAVNQLPLSDDIVPTMRRDPKSCVDNKAVMVAKNAKIVDVEWTVGGAMTIDKTELWYAKWEDVEGLIDCWTPPTDTTKFRKAKSYRGIVNGTGYFSIRGSHPSPTESLTGDVPTNGPLFRAAIPLDDMKQGDKVIVLATAKVDQSWKKQPAKVAPKLIPQSHIVNSRTDSEYYHESSGKRIRGHVDWFSVPLTVVIGDFDDSVGTRDEDLVNTIQLHPRFGDSTSTKGGIKPNAAKQGRIVSAASVLAFITFGVLALLGGTICCLRMFCSGQQDRLELKSSDEFDEGSDDFVFDSKPYSDQVRAEHGDDEDNGDDGGGIEIPQIA